MTITGSSICANTVQSYDLIVLDRCYATTAFAATPISDFEYFVADTTTAMVFDSFQAEPPIC